MLRSKIIKDKFWYKSGLKVEKPYCEVRAKQVYVLLYLYTLRPFFALNPCDVNKESDKKENFLKKEIRSSCAKANTFRIIGSRLPFLFM